MTGMALAQNPINAGKKIAVFVALCDNENQGIAPVPAKIGKGDEPETNLYWGCNDGLPNVWAKSKQWKLLDKKSDNQAAIMRSHHYQHNKDQSELWAFAYRGDEMKACLEAFEQALVGGKYDFVAFIGHNGLMDGEITPPQGKAPNAVACAVLCCKSREYFGLRLQALGAEPILLTEQYMYPGAFLLQASLEQWLSDKSLASIRQAAAEAYSKNQKISLKAALGIFTNLKKKAE